VSDVLVEIEAEVLIFKRWKPDIGKGINCDKG